jgi:hypothetical protein
MRDVVQAEVMMSFVISDELTFRIPVELEYDMADPLAVRLTFHLPGDAPVTWTFARELLRCTHRADRTRPPGGCPHPAQGGRRERGVPGRRRTVDGFPRSRRPTGAGG